MARRNARQFRRQREPHVLLLHLQLLEPAETRALQRRHQILHQVLRRRCARGHRDRVSRPSSHAGSTSPRHPPGTPARRSSRRPPPVASNWNCSASPPPAGGRRPAPPPSPPLPVLGGVADVLRRRALDVRETLLQAAPRCPASRPGSESSASGSTILSGSGTSSLSTSSTRLDHDGAIRAPRPACPITSSWSRWPISTIV